MQQTSHSNPITPPSATKPRLVVLTGAGMSVESGIPTFRGTNGLWENHRVEDVATPEAWARNPDQVLRFYNERRRKMLDCEPNDGHHGLVRLQKRFDVRIITQNIDNLHERAGSQNVLHLHGELIKQRSSLDTQGTDTKSIRNIEGWEMKPGTRCPRGALMRPHIVWFGEAVPLIETAAKIVSEADICVVIGTSLAVYPAAGLLEVAPADAPLFVIDPEPVHQRSAAGIRTRQRSIEHLQAGASEGVRRLESLI